MNLYPWEERAYNELLIKYEHFFKRLAELGRECFRIDSTEIFGNSIKELSNDEKKKIRDFWLKYVDDIDLHYHAYYIDRTGVFDERFIPDDIFAGYIDGYLNNRTIEAGMSDKNYLELFLNGFKLPKTYIHLINGIFEDSNYHILSHDDAINTLLKHDKFIVKPSMASYGGKGIKIFTNPRYEEVDEYINQIGCDNLIFQEIISQHPMTALLHPNSLNTIRIMTLIIDNDVKILHSAFRMGVGDSCVDNASFGGIYCSILADGRLSDHAYDAIGTRYDFHPNGGKFDIVKFDFMEKIQNTVKAAAQRFPHFRLIGWDVAVNENDEPVIIEANLTMSGLDVIETICGPLFGHYTETVLDEVFHFPKQKCMTMDILQYL